MLFRVGDFSAMIAVVLFALVPAVKYTAHGVRSVPAELIEAGVVCGCTRWQILRKIRLPMAVPMILLGLNQTILLALSMLVITALVGTRDLGQEVYAALATADVGRGLVAGLAVAAHRHHRRPADRGRCGRCKSQAGVGSMRPGDFFKEIAPEPLKAPDRSYQELRRPRGANVGEAAR